MPGDPPEYELYAIRYATRAAARSDHFIGGDPHDGPMPMDYFMWAAVGERQSFVIDAGYTAEVAAQRGRTFLRCPVEALKLIGLDGDTVSDVILTHLHYDHVGNFDRFPKARFHLQERELTYATGRYMRYPRLSHSFEVEDVCGIVRLNYASRVLFYDGDAEQGQRLHRTAQEGALAPRRDFGIEAGVDDKNLAASPRHPDEIVHRHRPVMWIAANEMRGAARLARGITDGKELVIDVTHDISCLLPVDGCSCAMPR